jgi:hypothetical protein
MSERDPAQPDSLETFFAAAKAETPTPRPQLIEAIVADAARVQVARATAAPHRPVRRDRLAGLRTVFAGIGGWRAATALAGCALIGLVAGLSGGAELGDAYLWTTATGDGSVASVEAFFDLATAEG